MALHTVVHGRLAEAAALASWKPPSTAILLTGLGSGERALSTETLSTMPAGRDERVST